VPLLFIEVDGVVRALKNSSLYTSSTPAPISPVCRTWTA